MLPMVLRKRNGLKIKVFLGWQFSLIIKTVTFELAATLYGGIGCQSLRQHFHQINWPSHHIQVPCDDAKRPELTYQLGKKTIQGKEDLVYFKLSGYSERCAILMNDTEDLIWELSLGSPSEETIGWVDLPQLILNKKEIFA